MHRDTTKEFSRIAVEKIDYFKSNPLGFFVSTMMAGAYVGVGMISLIAGKTDASFDNVEVRVDRP